MDLYIKNTKSGQEILIDNGKTESRAAVKAKELEKAGLDSYTAETEKKQKNSK